MPKVIARAVLLVSLALVPKAVAEDKARTSASRNKPTPSPILVEAFKGMTGTWDCRGSFKKMDGSGDMDSQSTMVISAELDGFTYSGAYQVPQSDMLPTGMQGQMFWSYDSASNKLVEFFADSYGGIGRGTSDGLKDNTLVWDENEVLMGQPKKVRTTIKRVNPKEMTLTFDSDANGTWVNMGSNTCKKQGASRKA
jgi:hypothetical protein